MNNTSETTSQDVEKYLNEKGFEYKETGDQYTLMTGCPLCNNGKGYHFYISREGLWDCKKCGESGNLWQLKERLGDKPDRSPAEFTQRAKSAPLPPPKPKVRPIVVDPKISHAYIEKCRETMFMEKPEILDYLTIDRGLSPEAVEHFKLGWDGNRIVIPIIEKGKVANVRYRKDPKNHDDKVPKYQSTTGIEIGMFNLDCIKQDGRAVFITEGEFDAMAIWSASKGTYQSVSGCGGAGSFKKEWAKKYFKGQRRIFICYDNDDPGRQGAIKAAQELGPNRCRIIDLPAGIKDVNEFFQKGHTLQEFVALASKSRRVPAQGDVFIEPISSVLGRVKEMIDGGGNVFTGCDTGFGELDSYIKRMRPGDLVVISGATGMGKTFFTQNVIYNLAKKGTSVMFFSLEMTPEQVAERFIMIDTKINTDKFGGGVIDLDAVELKAVEDSIVQLAKTPIYLYNGAGDMNKDSLAMVSQQAIDHFGCQIIVVDHLHYFASSAEDTAEISAIVRKAKIIARDNEVPVVMISHIRKTASDSTAPGVQDLRNSSLIGQDADVILMISRDKNNASEDERKKVVVNVLKNRHGREGSVNMTFDFDSGRFYDLDTVHDPDPIPAPKPKQSSMLPANPRSPFDPTRAGYKDN